MPKIYKKNSKKSEADSTVAPLDYSFNEPSALLKSKNLPENELFTRAELLETSFSKFLSEDYPVIPALYPGDFLGITPVFEIESIYRDLQEALIRTEEKGGAHFTEKKMLEPLLETLGNLEEDALLAKELGLTKSGEKYPDWLVPPLHLLIAYINSKDTSDNKGLFNFHALMELSLEYFPNTYNFLLRSRLIAECREPLIKLMEFSPELCEDKAALEDAKSLIRELEETLIEGLRNDYLGVFAHRNFFNLLKLEEETHRGRVGLVNSPARGLPDFLGLTGLINYRTSDKASMKNRDKLEALAIYGLRIRTIHSLIETYKYYLDEWLLKADLEAQGLSYTGPIVSTVGFKNPFSKNTKQKILNTLLLLVEDDLMRSAEEIGEHFVINS